MNQKETQNLNETLFVADDMYIHLIGLLEERGYTEIEAVERLKELGVETTPL